MTRQQLGKISCIALLHSCPQEEVHKLPALPAAPTRPRCRIAWRQQAGSSEECVAVRQGAGTNKLHKLHKYVAVQARWERAPLCKSYFAMLRLSIAFNLAHIYF